MNVEHPVWGPYYENNTHLIKLSNEGTTCGIASIFIPPQQTRSGSSYPRHLATNADGTITIGGLVALPPFQSLEGGQHIGSCIWIRSAVWCRAVRILRQ